jgi:hypothetical protein
MKYKIRSFALLLFAFTAFAINLGAKTVQVVVHSEADEQFVKEREGSSVLKPISYAFAEGNYFPGDSRDKTIGRESFGAILTNLARDLEMQRFYPVNPDDTDAAEQLIVVHWGTTIIDEIAQQQQEDFIEAINAYSGSAADDFEAKNELFSAVQQQESNRDSAAQYISNNANILGYTEELNQELKKDVFGQSPRVDTLLQHVGETRYFVILLAWDYQALRETGKRKMLWSTRFNIRMTGNNFALALPEMSKAASDYFATNTEKLTTRKTTMYKSNAKFGEIEVIGIEE